MHSILVTSPDILSKWCGVLRATAGLTDRDIAAKPFFSGIPPGTINSIRKHGKVPAKWKQRLHCLCPHCGRLNHDYDCTTEKPVPLEATVTMPKAPGKQRNRRAVSLDDPESAAATIIRAGVSAEYLARLSELLEITK